MKNFIWWHSHFGSFQPSYPAVGARCLGYCFSALLVSALTWSGQAQLPGGQTPAAHAQSGPVYYVSQTSGNDDNNGTSPETAWQTVARVNRTRFSPGDTVLFQSGGQWNDELKIESAGNEAQPLKFASYGDGPAPVLRQVVVQGDYVVIQNFTIDHQKMDDEAVTVKAKFVTLRNLEIRNGTGDGIGARDADGLLIDACHIHHFLSGSFDKQQDAHGIEAVDVQGLTVKNTEIHHVSGDSFQADPARGPNVSREILIEDSHFWTGPLQEDFNEWKAGEIPGENAIDTKVALDGWQDLPRSTLTVRNLVAHGWVDDGSNERRAVFHLKEKINAVFDGVTVYDAQIAFRITGAYGNANVTLKNGLIYDVANAIRVEEDLKDLKVYNTTFGYRIDKPLHVAVGGDGNIASWEFRNNAFVDKNPPA
ncbi:MAG TPA: right-handed parallel beta-helix repeat-containing protein, partial [Anaerolineae bacterium]|nr:right-handed parallel beta-helix repeat-containing protein [Anaerolineae bacterium]